jgi:hypothetical protein
MSGTMFYGSSPDGSDAKEFEGVYVHPDGKQWSSNPWKLTKEDRLYWSIRDHIDGKKSFQLEYDLVMAKKSKLSRAQRDYLIQLIENPVNNGK